MSDQIETTESVEAEIVGDEASNSRRRLFQMGLAGAAAIAGAAALDAASSAPAGAATGDALIIGEANEGTSEAYTVLLGSGLSILNGVAGANNPAIAGTNTLGPGVQGGAATTFVGVLGTSATGFGVEGTSAGVGVHGGSSGNGGVGVSGSAPSSGTLGTIGVSGSGIVGVQGQSNAGSTPIAIGVLGIGSGKGPGLGGQNSAGPSLNLSAQTSATLPTDSSVGDFIVLPNGSLHYSYGGGNDWVQLNNGIVTLPTPVRVIDSLTSVGIAAPGGIASGGSTAGGAPTHQSVVLSGLNGIPSQALGLVGNLAIAVHGGGTLNGFGVAALFPAGSPTPATANINAGAGCFAISNSVTVAFGTGADAGKVALVWYGGGSVQTIDVYFDVAGYIL